MDRLSVRLMQTCQNKKRNMKVVGHSFFAPFIVPCSSADESIHHRKGGCLFAWFVETWERRGRNIEMCLDLGKLIGQ